MAFRLPDIKSISSDPKQGLRDIINILNRYRFQLEHIVNQLDSSQIKAPIPNSKIDSGEYWNDAAENFNNRNDRNQTIPSNPVIANDGTAIDHTINTDGSANISFEWIYDGTGPGYDVDGFYVYVYASDEPTSYAFGTHMGLESVNPVPHGTRAYIIEGVPADQYYTFGVQAYRCVDQDIDSSGELRSGIIKSSYAGEDPYQPEMEVAFAGSIIGTVGNKPVSEIADFIEIDYPEDQVIINDQIAQKKRVFKVTPTPPYDADDLWCPGPTGEFRICTTARTKDEDYDPDDWEPASDSVRLGTKYNLNSISTEDGFKSEDEDGNYTQMNAGGLKHHQRTLATLSGNLTNSATYMAVSTDAFPADTPFFIRIDNEIIKVNAKSGTAFTSITRGQAGTEATAHNSGAEVLLTKDYFYLIEIGRTSTVGSGYRAYDADPPNDDKYTGEEEYLTYVPPITVQLPNDFKGKNFKVFAEIRMNGVNLDTFYTRAVRANDYALIADVVWVCEVYDIDHVNATFKIKAYSYVYALESGSSSKWIENLDGVDVTYTVTA